MPNSNRRVGFGFGLLLYQIFGVIGVDRIPPATLTLVALQIGLFLRLFRAPWHSPEDVCMSVHYVWEKQHWYRFLFAAFEHANDMHLYYNMVSFIWKGISLERRFGSAKFTYLVILFTFLCNLTYLILCQAASGYLNYQYVHHCAVGFSGVIFALKVLTTHYLPSGRHYVMGLPIFMPAEYIVWAELLLIHLLAPNTSFIGHLAGILVGVAYINGPLKFITDYIWNIISSVLFVDPNQHRFRHAPQYEQYVGHGISEEEQLEHAHYESLRQEHMRNTYMPYNMSEDEQLHWATEESLRYNNGSFQSYNSRTLPSAPYMDEHLPYPSTSNRVPFSQASPPPYPEQFASRSNLYPDLDEIRRHRLNRFS